MGPPKEGSRLRKAIPPFQAFLDAHRTAVYRFLMVSVGPNEADDCFQETFLSALRAYPRLRDGSNLRGWVLAIATRKAIDAARARNRRALPVADPADEAPAALAVDAADPPDDDLWRAVAGLPLRQRMAVVHRFVLDESYAEIGAAMGSTEEAARANVYQGLKKLREVEPR
jgi:RNA polymerase sigma factor (sigma-70 family)